MPIRPRNRRRRITECRSESSRLEPLSQSLAGSGTFSPPLAVPATPHERHTARPTPRPGLQSGPEAREAAPRRQAETGRAVAAAGAREGEEAASTQHRQARGHRSRQGLRDSRPAREGRTHRGRAPEAGAGAPAARSQGETRRADQGQGDQRRQGRRREGWGKSVSVREVLGERRIIKKKKHKKMKTK